MNNSPSIEAERTSRDVYASYHFERYYDYSQREYRTWFRKYAWYYRGLLPDSRHARILDLGCGGGRFLAYLASRGYVNICGVDSDPRQLASALTAANCEIHKGDVLQFLATRAECYDFTSCHHVIEHLSRSDAIDLLRLTRQSLTPGGRIIVSTPNGARPWMGWHLFADLSHDHLYTSSSLKEVMELAGFKDVAVRAEGVVPHDLLSTARWLLWKVWREPYLKFTFAIESGLGCLNDAPLVVSEGLIATGVK